MQIKIKSNNLQFVESEINSTLKDFSHKLWQERIDDYGTFTPTIIFDSTVDEDYNIEYYDRLTFNIRCSSKNWKESVHRGISNISGYIGARNLTTSGLYNMNVDNLVIKDLLIHWDLPFNDVFEENVGKYIECLYCVFLLTWKKGSRDVAWMDYYRNHMPKNEQQKDLHARLANFL